MVRPAHACLSSFKVYHFISATVTSGASSKVWTSGERRRPQDATAVGARPCQGASMQASARPRFSCQATSSCRRRADRAARLHGHMLTHRQPKGFLVPVLQPKAESGKITPHFLAIFLVIFCCFFFIMPRTSGLLPTRRRAPVPLASACRLLTTCLP